MSELLSPAGGAEQLYAAVRSGADAVYLGLKNFSARGNAENFDEEELKQAVSYCHIRAVRVYAAVNTIIFDAELAALKDILKLLCCVGVDGVIVQDLAVLKLAEKCCPSLRLHASTQMTIHAESGVRLAKDIGFERIVLSRELPKEIIEELSGLGVETEVFVHGALCMSVSGQCYMSAAIGGRSANRGLCAQPCRLPCSCNQYIVSDRYYLSLRDLSLMDVLCELDETGVSSFKIEGRMKRPEYAALCVSSARNALDGKPYDKKLLENVFSRGGFTDGYYRSRHGRSMFGRRTAEDAQTSKKAYPRIHEIYRKEFKRSFIDFKVEAQTGEPLIVKACDENGLCAVFSGGTVSAANNLPTDEALVRKQLSRLGDSFFTLRSLDCKISGNCYISPALLNNARRELLHKLCVLREDYYSGKIPFSDEGFRFPAVKKSEKKDAPSIRINAFKADQLRNLDPENTELAFIPLNFAEAEAALEFFPAERLGVSMPRFTFDEKKDVSLLRKIAELGIKHILCQNIAHIKIANDLGLFAHGSFGLNAANSLALEMLGDMGLIDCVASFELKASQINALRGIPTGVYAYGRLPLMLTANCPIAAHIGCSACHDKQCHGRLYDRTGRAFPIKCSRKNGYTELLNCDILCISDKLSAFGGASFFQIELFDETPERAADTVKLFINRKKCSSEKLTVTKGLYFRGLKNNNI